MNQYREEIKKESNSVHVPEKLMTLFEEVSTKISSIMVELDKNMQDTFKMIIESCIKALKEKGQYKDVESLSFGQDNTTYVYDPKHPTSAPDEMKIS